MVQLLPSRPTRASSSISGSTLTVILIVGGMVAALYFGREVLVPIALALLLSFVLAPLVRRLQSWRFPRVVAVSIVAIFAFATIFGLGAFMVSQVSQLANDLPRYESNLTDKIQSLQGVAARYRPARQFSGQGLLKSSAYAAGRMRARPVSSSLTLRRCAGLSVTMTSRVGRTWPSPRWPALALPSRVPSTMWI
jgi:predicted PurR-regulated permease PerM